MYFVLQTPSLHHLALVKIVAHLWNRRDILTRIALSFHSQPAQHLHENAEEWKVFEKKVAAKVWALPLTELFKNQLVNLINPLGVQIINWCTYHYLDKGIKRINDFRHLKNLVPEQLCWTMHGTVKYSQTARLILKDETVDVKHRYEIACLNCLEDEARHLITFIPETQRQKYMNAVEHSGNNRWHSGVSYFSHDVIRILIVYFTCTLSGKADQLSRLLYQRRLRQGESINKYFFEVMLLNGNRTTCEYWFKNCSQQEKDQVLLEFQRRIFYFTHHHANYNLMYYLSLLNEEQQKRMLRECDGELLKCLLRWPTQSLFMKAAECWWGYMDEDNCAWLLHAIVVKICDGYTDYDYSQLFWKCWRLSSNKYKQFYLVNTQYAEHALREKQEEFLKLILNEAPSNEIEVFFDVLSEVLMDKYCVLSDFTLKKCLRKATLISSFDSQNVKKRLRSQHLSRLVDIVMKSRINTRRMRIVRRPTFRG